MWAFPTLFYVATLFYPTDVVRRQLDASMRWALPLVHARILNLVLA